MTKFKGSQKILKKSFLDSNEMENLVGFYILLAYSCVVANELSQTNFTHLSNQKKLLLNIGENDASSIVGHGLVKVLSYLLEENSRQSKFATTLVFWKTENLLSHHWVSKGKGCF